MLRLKQHKTRHMRGTCRQQLDSANTYILAQILPVAVQSLICLIRSPRV